LSDESILNSYAASDREPCERKLSGEQIKSKSIASHGFLSKDQAMLFGQIEELGQEMEESYQ
jgi:hypothetical protein